MSWASRSAPGCSSACETRVRGVAVVELLEVVVALYLGAGDVEARRVAGAGEGDVAPFLQTAVVGAEHERTVDGQPLASVPVSA